MASRRPARLVAAIRAQLGVSQEELARRLGVSFATVNAWENGRSTPRPDHRDALVELARELGMAQGLTLLVIDDEEDHVDLVREIVALEAPGVEVLTATQGVRGLLLCGARRPDVVLVDIAMPDLDGFAFVEAMSEIEGLESTDVWFYTGLQDEETLQQAARAGVRGVIAKPLTGEQVDRLLAVASGIGTTRTRTLRPDSSSEQTRST